MSHPRPKFGKPLDLPNVRALLKERAKQGWVRTGSVRPLGETSDHHLALSFAVQTLQEESQKMIVVLQSFGWDGSSFIGVFSSVEKAREYLSGIEYPDLKISDLRYYEAELDTEIDYCDLPRKLFDSQEEPSDGTDSPN